MSTLRKITTQEQIALVKAFRQYSEKIQGANYKYKKTDLEPIVRAVDALKDEFLPIFRKNMHVKERLIDKTETQVVQIFKFNDEDLRSLFTERQPAQYLLNSRNITSTLKGRLIICSLQNLGYYEAPDIHSEKALYEVIVSEIFNSKPPNLTSLNLEGFYQLVRLSFNSSFPGHVATSLVEIYNDIDVLRYRTINSYTQMQSGSDKGLVRERRSSGFLFDYQGQILFLGSINYSHLHMYDINHNLTEKEKEKDKYNYYPEIILAHPHGGDQLNLRSLILGHYPYLSLPVSSRAYFIRQPHLSGKNIDELAKETAEVTIDGDKQEIPRYFGNINPDNLDLTNPLHKIVKKSLPFIKNSIESTYSHMLTP
ncbi:hypothetical protein [Marinomonas mediterranea]|jgi:hypothetical protein|uniref:Uncharacterized protein n=1 Tax=Marinomonas mediterranea (strain ATCC 700492 / JCM 21426 / NBRC 103028 / MMB-1) TaxID=717774 RepID=F2JZH6_MARM1|nr:hypothetical protein [Marinomonas mediterranea]ADZ89759.1 hypothetical protein Marme_0462 [Marinomonas mediterranea MMB-1]WCN15984.1 hypothetical protein GV053_02305 [Marinomonas mediterranea MMB-1]